VKQVTASIAVWLLLIMAIIALFWFGTYEAPPLFQGFVEERNRSEYAREPARLIGKPMSSLTSLGMPNSSALRIADLVFSLGGLTRQDAEFFRANLRSSVVFGSGKIWIINVSPARLIDDFTDGSLARFRYSVIETLKPPVLIFSLLDVQHDQFSQLVSGLLPRRALAVSIENGVITDCKVCWEPITLDRWIFLIFLFVFGRGLIRAIIYGFKLCTKR